MPIITPNQARSGQVKAGSQVQVTSLHHNVYNVKIRATVSFSAGNVNGSIDNYSSKLQTLRVCVS